MKTLVQELNAVKRREANLGTLRYEEKNLAPNISKTGNMRPLTLKGFACPSCNHFFPVRVKRAMEGECTQCATKFRTELHEGDAGEMVITATIK